MTQVKLFSAEYQRILEEDVNVFIKEKDVISVSYSTNTVGYSTRHYCCVVYRV